MSDFRKDDPVHSIAHGPGVVVDSEIMGNYTSVVLFEFKDVHNKEVRIPYTREGKKFVSDKIPDLYHGREPIVIEDREVPCRLQVGDWVLISKPVNNDNLIIWNDQMNRLDGTIQKISGINPDTNNMSLEGFFWTCRPEWLTEAEEPTPDLPENTRMIVWADDSTNKENRYLSHFDEKGRCWCFLDGKTSWTTAVTSCWDNYEVAEDD